MIDGVTKARAPAEMVESLVAESDRFLRFLGPRVAGPEAAEEVLQAAFVRAFERASEVREPARLGAWFYRLLRNTLSDHYRREAAGTRAISWKSRPLATAPAPEPQPRRICQCWKELLPHLSAEHAEILRKVDLEGVRVTDLARNLGISPNNAMVRLYRARQALRARLVEFCGPSCAEGGCLDCDCAERKTDAARHPHA